MDITIADVIQVSAMVIGFGKEIMFNDDDDDDDEVENTTILEKVDNFAEETVPRFSHRQFKENFRMNPDTFEDMLRKIHSVQIDHLQTRPGQPQVSLEKQGLIVIWCLANMESFRSVAGRFGISKSTCWDVLRRTCLELTEVNRRYHLISWPTPERAMQTAQHFENINGFPGVIGSIDGSHVKILPPRENPNSYYNRKKFHSVLLQGICDHRKLFIDVFVGAPGSMHDQRLFEKSDFFEDMNNGLIEFPDNCHLIGDLAYKLRTNLLVGFKNLGNLTNRQKNFNMKLSQIRVIIENAFAFLKGRFRRLKYLETIRLDLICLLIYSACILHNICILNGDELEEIAIVQNEIDEERNNLNENVENDNVAEENRNAQRKRTGIMNNLIMANNVFP